VTDRLPPQPEEWILRGRPIRFRFEGRDYSGFAGDSISTALWASGVRVLGRSFKYHRPRGILSLADLDCNAVAEDGRSTNIRMDQTSIAEGMDLRAVNTWGGCDRDVGQFMDWLSPLFPVGFYYKAFHTPRRLFPFYEKKMRQMAGLGRINPARPLTHSPKRYDFCDVLVVGSGPAGLSAAIAAAEQGLRVLLVEEKAQLGGTLCFQLAGEPEARALRRRLLDRARSLPTLEIRTSTVAAGYYADHWVALIDAVRLTKLRARSVVVATGCHEQPAVFRNNDLPGVMLASAAQRLVHQFAVRPCRAAVVLAANSEGYRAALDLVEAGTKVAVIADLRPDGERSPLRQKAEQSGLWIRRGYGVYEAVPGRGNRTVQAAVLCPLAADGALIIRDSSQVACDGIVLSVGWAPADAILRQGGVRMAYDGTLEQFVPTEIPSGLFAAGRVNGNYALEDQLADGRRAGLEAAAFLGAYAPDAGSRPQRRGPSPNHPFPIFSHPRGKNFVDFDEDLQLKDFKHAVQEGFDSIELLKRYSTFGMGPSQGKHSNLNAVRILARLRGENLNCTGVTTARPFTSPVSLGHLAGRIFSPHRQTPMHSEHQRLGAKFMHAGNWLRPEYYARRDFSREEAIRTEVKAVRERAGLIDVGTLGKIEINGPDAAEFIERMYTARFAKLKVGATRYVLMCDESGVIIDDGVAARLAPNRFYVTTTTSGSDSVAREMKRWAIVWGLQVVLVNMTGAYAAMNLAGPVSRQVLEKQTDIDLSAEQFPYLGAREGRVAGVPARLLRVGFVGELGYEIHVPADSGLWVWNQIMEAGRSYGIQPFGVEAQRILRLEKGHVIIGQDSDGLTHPVEAGMEWALKMDKAFFVGQRSLEILGKKPLERQLVGFTLPADFGGPFPKECHLVIDRGEIAGRVTSVVFSPTLERTIGLAYVKPGQSQVGNRFWIRVDGDALVEATVVKTPFYDPDSLRQTQSPVLQEVS
jgi:sarcosine oxidase subunit alpha